MSAELFDDLRRHASNLRRYPFESATMAEAAALAANIIDNTIQRFAPCDTRRMAETGTGSVRSTGSAVPEGEASQ